MTGENDLGCSPDHNKRMANEILNSKLVILPKYKHSFLIEAPKEVAKNLIEFIKQKMTKTNSKTKTIEKEKVVAETLNGRFAMIGLIAAIGAYLTLSLIHI